jgi:hypothetical protein
MKSAFDSNFLGVAWIDDDLPKRTHNKVNKKMEELEEKACEEFNAWLESQGLEQAMGVIIKKKG